MRLHNILRKSFKLHRGFTLIELLVVISIVGLLASVLMAAIQVGRRRSRDAKRQADLRQVQLALGLYYDKYGSYPITDDGSGSGGGGGQGKKGKGKANGKKKISSIWEFSTDGSLWLGCNVCYDEEDPDSITEYLHVEPMDPQNTTADPRIQGNYSYAYYSLTGDDYDLVAQLEDAGGSLTCASRCWTSHEQSPGKAWCPVCPNPNLNYSNYIYTDH